MNDFELESKLKSVPVPSRSEEYWEHFPFSVRSQLRVALSQPPRRSLFPQLAWGGAIAVALLIMTLTVWPVFQVILKNEHTIRRELSQLPHHLHVFMADEHGMHYLIADQQ
jgi:hypothetical protein